MKLLIVGIVFALSGCFYQSTSNEDIERAQKACASRDSEVEEIIVKFNGTEQVICTNNDHIRLDARRN